MAKQTSRRPRVVVIPGPDEAGARLEKMVKSGRWRPLRYLKLIGGYVCEAESREKLEIAGHPDFTGEIFEDQRVSIINPIPVHSFLRVSTNDWGLKTIQAPEAWKYSQGSGVNVAVLDTGASLNHPALRGRIKGGVNLLSSGRLPQDDNGHGTQVAGIIASRLSAAGAPGVAPKAGLYVVKIFDSNGEANLSDIISGIQWCLDKGISLANLSFGMTESHPLLQKSVQNATKAGLTLVCAAGNEGKPNSVMYPARYPETIAVSALDQSGGLAGFSSRGPEVDLIAPGTEIRSAAPGGRYSVQSGTSFAAPHVTGVLALLQAMQPRRNPEVLRETLYQTAVTVPKLKNPEQGHGLVNALAAVKRLDSN